MTNPPRPHRTPKVKEFVSAPYITCPDCGEQKFGVLMIGDHQYSRRCINCWFDKRFPLPKLSKKVIYLDQFVISNMMKQLDPNTPPSQRGHHAGFFQELFQTLDRVCKLQLAVCPESCVHDHESVVTGSHYGNLRRVFRHLSYEVRLHSPDGIFHRQAVKCFEAWLAGSIPEMLGERRMALDGKVDAWTDKIRIDLNYTVPGLAKELSKAVDAKTKHLHGVCSSWQQEPDFSFKSIFENEVRKLGRSVLNQFTRYLGKFERASRGELAVSEIAFPPHEVSLMHSLLRVAENAAENPGLRLEKIAAFFASKAFQKVPYVKVWGLFWATLARVVRSGMKPDNFPTGSIYNDLDVIAAYSPYCDAMFVDLEVESLSRQGDLGRCLATGAKFFSLRSKEAFLDYLKEVERNASSEHLALVKDVYGSSAGTPFLSLLTWDKNKGTTTPPT